MKRIILVFTILSTLLCLVACKNQIEYAEKNIKDSCYWNDYEIVTMDIAYPEFDVDKYPRLNEAILSEFSGLKNEYISLCNDRQKLCEKDPVSAKLKCYITANYEVNIQGDTILITLIQDYFGGGAACHGYAKTIEYNTKTNKLVETKSGIH